MSHRIYVKIPGIDGSALVPGHENEIEAESFDYGLAVPHQTGRVRGSPEHRDVEIIKHTDVASAPLMAALVKAERFSEITISFTRIGGSSPEDFATIKLKNAAIVGWHLSSDTDDDTTPQPLEQVTLTFEEIEVEILNNRAGSRKSRG